MPPGHGHARMGALPDASRRNAAILPLSGREIPMNPHVDQPLPHGSKTGFLFAVDDDEHDRRLLARRLAETGLPFAHRLFGAGEELLDAMIDVLRGAPPPVVCFVDVKMAGMSGLDVLRWIRAQRALDAVPVVMLSSSDDPQYLSEAQHFGAQCYVSKFPTAEHLREIISAACAYADASSTNASFPLACNLLASSHASAK